MRIDYRNSQPSIANLRLLWEALERQARIARLPSSPVFSLMLDSLSDLCSTAALWLLEGIQAEPLKQYGPRYIDEVVEHDTGYKYTPVSPLGNQAQYTPRDHKEIVKSDILSEVFYGLSSYFVTLKHNLRNPSFMEGNPLAAIQEKDEVGHKERTKDNRTKNYYYQRRQRNKKRRINPH